MSDTRFILGGIVLVIVGFTILGVFESESVKVDLGDAGMTSDESVEASFTEQSTGAPTQSERCYQAVPNVPGSYLTIDCQDALFNKILLFVVTLGLVGAGIVCLVLGARGKWDQQVKADDMVGPGSDKSNDGTK